MQLATLVATNLICLRFNLIPSLFFIVQYVHAQPTDTVTSATTSIAVKTPKPVDKKPTKLTKEYLIYY